jgi:RNA polymerase sigma factor (sigma-70 family)
MFDKTKIKEQELIDGCIKNDRKMQKALYDTYFDTMFGMCLKHTKDKDEALEVLNEGFFKIFTKLNTFSGLGSFEGWMRRVIYHCIMDHFNSKNKNIQFLEIENIQESNNSFNTGYHNLVYDDLERLIEEVPQASRQVFVNYVIEGFNHKEIAEKHNISEGTSKWHLSNAREILRKKISQNESFDLKVK